MKDRLERGKRKGVEPAKSEQHEGRESELHSLIKQECSRRQWLCFIGATHKRAWRPLGEPDALIYADGGRCFMIECKTAKGKLRPEQIGVAMLAERLGHKVHVIRSFGEFLKVVDNCKF